MQPLTLSPRTEFTEDQVRALFVADDLEVDFGVDLLSPSLAFVEDISADVSSGTVHRDMAADIHGTLDLTIAKELAWGKDRVRPWMVLSSISADVVDCRFNLGAYLVTSPEKVLGESPQSFTVTGYDLLTLLQNPVSSSYVVIADTNVLTAVRAVLTAAGVTTPVLFDTASSSKVTASHRVWVQDESTSPTYIGVANDLLASIGYRGLWVDWDGRFRSGPYVLPSARPSEYMLDVGSLTTGIVGERSVVQDYWQTPNWFRVIRKDTPTRPTEGAGRYTMTNPSTGPSSFDAVGRNVKADVVYLDATSQGDLVTQGNRLFAAATRVAEVLTLKMSPLPCSFHSDRLTYSDPDLGVAREVIGRSFDLPLTGEDMSYVVESV